MREFGYFSNIDVLFSKVTEGSRLRALTVDSEGLAYDEKSGQFFLVNRTGAATFELLLATRDIDATVGALADRYGVAKNLVFGEVESFVRQLAWHRIV